MRFDAIFIHSPSVYDFRQRPILFGPVSDVVPSTPLFEMYPIGFVTLADYLERHGFTVRIVNIAVKMLKDPGLDVEALIKSLDARLFGLDLHWLPHAQGAVEMARIIKKHHPRTPLVFGGLSATYFAGELIRYPQVDMVMKGDSTEEPMRILLETLKKGGSLAGVPNLTFKDATGAVCAHPISYVPEKLSNARINYARVIKDVIRDKDINGYLPFKDFLRYPAVVSLTCRGCVNNCAICGGSRFTYKTFFNRPRVALRDPEELASEVADAARYFTGPVVIVGDIQAGGQEHAYRFLDALARYKVKNMVVFEFWDAPPKELYERIARSLKEWSFEISCESQDERVRKLFTKAHFTNEQFRQSLIDGLEAGAKRADVYLFVGIPFQTKESIMAIPDFAEYLYEGLNGHRSKLLCFAAPLAPFVDPGSLAFEKPEDYGYRITRRTLQEHINAVNEPSWKYSLNYENEAVDRDSFVEATYDCAVKLNEVKKRMGAMGYDAERVTRTILEAKKIMQIIDDIHTSDLPQREKERRYFELKDGMATHSMSTVCEKKELEWSVPMLRKFRPSGLLRALLRR